MTESLSPIGKNLIELGIDPADPFAFGKLCELMSAAYKSGELTDDMIEDALEPQEPDQEQSGG